MTTTKNRPSALPKTSLFLLVAAAALGACAAELEGKPEDYQKAYQAPSGAGTASMPGASGRGSGGSTSSSGGSTSPSGGSTSPSGGSTSPSGGSTSPSGGKGGVTIPPDPACLSAAITAGACTGCHSAMLVKLGGFDISGMNLGQRFSGQQATYKDLTDTSKCKPGALLIDPERPSESVLLKKVMGTQDCGAMMPTTKLSATHLKCFEDWINSFSASANVTSFDQASGSGGENL